MQTITTIDSAKTLLATDSSLMIKMEMDFSCWIQQGIRDENDTLVAQGPKVAQLAEDVFDTLIPEMDQVYCSEYFQVSKQEANVSTSAQASAAVAS
jgi:hypothetical protein